MPRFNSLSNSLSKNSLFKNRKYTLRKAALRKAAEKAVASQAVASLKSWFIPALVLLISFGISLQSGLQRAVPASADTGVISRDFSILNTSYVPFGGTTPGATLWVALNGQNVCAVVYHSVGGGSVATVQGASDLVQTPVTVTGIGTNGVITNPTAGSAVGGSIAPQALTYIRLVFSSITGGPITGTITCSPSQVPSSGGTGGTSTVTFPYSLASNGQSGTSASGIGILGLYNSSLPSLTSGQAAPIQVDQNGRIIFAPGQFPSPIPNSSSSPYFIQCVANGCPTAPAIQPVSGTVTANAGTGFSFPTPIPNSSASPFFVQCITNGCPTAPATQNVSGTVTANAGTGFSFPTPIPNSSSSPYFVQCIANGCPTPPANQTVNGTVTANAGTGFTFPTPIPNTSASPYYTYDIRPSPAPCATSAGAGICSQHSTDLIPEAGPTAIAANGTVTLQLSGVHTLCKINLSAPFIGSVTANTSKDGTTNFNQVPITPQNLYPVFTVYQTNSGSQDYEFPVSGMHGAQITIANYLQGTATLNCDVQPPIWERVYQNSNGVAVIGTTIGQKMTFPTVIPTTTSSITTNLGVAQAVPISSSSGFVVGESINITGSDTNTENGLTVLFVSSGYITAVFNQTHVSGSTITPNSTQSFPATLYGIQNTCISSTDNAFAGTATPYVSTNGTAFSATVSYSNLQANYNQPSYTLATTNGNWSTIVGGEQAFRISITGWTAGGITSSCDSGVRPSGPIVIGSGNVTACPAGNTVNPTQLLPGPNGLRFALLATTGSISFITGAAAPAATPSPNPTNYFTLSYPYVTTDNELLGPGQALFIVSSTNCVYRTF